jgi:hypothetical protein
MWLGGSGRSVHNAIEVIEAYEQSRLAGKHTKWCPSKNSVLKQARLEQ